MSASPRRTPVVLALAAVIAAGIAAPALADERGRPLPIAFEANAGQADPSVKFIARGSGYTVALTSTEALLKFRQETLRLSLVGASARPRVEGRGVLAARSHYYSGNDRANWQINIPMYEKASYEAVYPGVDLVYYGNQGQLEYDFIVAPRTDPRQIAVSFTGTRDIRIDADGSLALVMSHGEIRQPAPVVYQDVRGERKLIPARYVVKDRNARVVAFEVGAYDKTKPLVIDPTLGYSTYLGGTSWDTATGITVDAAGNSYVTGFTTSGDFPGSPCDQSFGLVYCTFVTKISAAGTLVYSTVLAGSDGRGIAIDSTGNAYVTGGAGPMLTIVNGYQPFHQGHADGFVAKLGPTGTLLYSSFIGGGGNDLGLGVAADASGRAYVVGFHNAGTGFQTTPNAILDYNPSWGCPGGGFTGWLVRVNTNAAGLASLEYSTNIAGFADGTNFASGVAVDGAGNAYVSGATTSWYFPTTAGAFQPAPNGFVGCWIAADAYVVKINTAPASCTGAYVNSTWLSCPQGLLYSTLLGGTLDDFANDIAIDATGNATITGGSTSADFPMSVGAAQSANAGGYDSFVAKLNATASALDYSTYLGGSGDDIANHLVLDAAGKPSVIGSTNSAAFPTTADAIQGANAGGLNDAFVTRLNATGSALDYSSYLGGSADDRGNDIGTDAAGNLYAVGLTYSTDLPTTPGAIQPAFAGGAVEHDGFVTKITFTPPTPQEEIASVVDDIAALPGLTPAQVSSATAKLNAALNSLANGNTGAAANQLNALTNQIRALINSRRVSPTDGQAVIDAVDGIIDQITP